MNIRLIQFQDGIAMQRDGYDVGYFKFSDGWTLQKVDEVARTLVMSILGGLRYNRVYVPIHYEG